MYIGLDLGTSGLKGVLIDDSQRVLAEASAPLTVRRLFEGWSEQDPAQWISAAETVLGQLATHGPIRAIGLSGHMHGATVLDASNQVLRPCMLWNDTRSHLEAAQMDANPAFRAISGNIVFPGFTAPKVEWLRSHEPALWSRIAMILLPKDYLRLWLTGDHISEMSDSAGTAWFDTGRRDWSDDLLSTCNLTRAQMPKLIEGSSASGTLRPELAARLGLPPGVIVAGGGGDNAAAGVGVGVVRAGEAFVSLGTSGVLFAANNGYQPDPATAVHTFCHALPATWHQMGVILAATDALNWYAGLVGQTAATLTGELGPLQAPSKTRFLPYLGGERTPLNDAAIRGAFIGLEHSTDRSAGTRAGFQGGHRLLESRHRGVAVPGVDIVPTLAGEDLVHVLHAFVGEGRGRVDRCRHRPSDRGPASLARVNHLRPESGFCHVSSEAPGRTPAPGRVSTPRNHCQGEPRACTFAPSRSR